MGLLVVAMVVTASSVVSLQTKNGLPPYNQVVAWSILGMSFVIVSSCNFTLIGLVISSLYPFIPQAQHTSPKSKIVTFFLAFSVCFVILSISIEGLFYSAFAYNLLLWIDVEAVVRKPLHANGSTPKEVRTDEYRFQADDVRIALFFLFFVQVAFFGTGKYVQSVRCLLASYANLSNLQRCIHIVSSTAWYLGMRLSHTASSSFYLEPVYRLVPVFNPFLMAVLLVGTSISSHKTADWTRVDIQNCRTICDPISNFCDSERPFRLTSVLPFPCGVNPD